VSDLGLPDIPYFKGAPVFQPQSPASRNEATREMKSPVFQLGPVNHQSPHTVTLYGPCTCIVAIAYMATMQFMRNSTVYYIMQHTVLLGLRTLKRVVPQTSVVPHSEH